MAKKRKNDDKTSPYGPKYPPSVDRPYEKAIYDTSKTVKETIEYPFRLAAFGGKVLARNIKNSKTVPTVAGNIAKTIAYPVEVAAYVVKKATKKTQPKNKKK